VARWPLFVALVAVSWAAAGCLVLGLVSFAQFPAELRSGSGIIGEPVQFVLLGGGGLPAEGVERTIADLSTANVAVPSLVAITATAVAALRRRGRPPRGVLWVALGLQVGSLLLELSARGLRSDGSVVVLYNFFRNHPARALLLAASTAMLLWVALAATAADRRAAQPAVTADV